MNALTFKQVRQIAERPTSPGIAPVEHRRATIAAAVFVMKRPAANVSPVLLADAAAVLAEAPIEVIARAVLKIVAAFETFTVPAFLSVLRAETGAQDAEPADTEGKEGDETPPSAEPV